MVFDSLLRMDTEINSKINFFPEKFLKKKIQFLLIAGRRKLAQIVIKDHFGHVTPNRENKMTYKSGTPRPDTSVP
jgi:hypothetical protein